MKVKSESRRPQGRGRIAVWQARLALLIMINLAQLWILSAAIEAALAHEYRQLVPLVAASGICWLIALTIIMMLPTDADEVTVDGCGVFEGHVAAEGSGPSNGESWIDTQVEESDKSNEF